MTPSRASAPARDIKGAIHVHSEYSDGTGSVEEIIAAAQAARLDFLILSDHDSTGAALDGYQGRHGGVLLVVGAEVSPPRGGHCLALGADDVNAYRWMSEKHYLRRLRRQHADIYVAHPEGRVNATFGINLRQWHVWESEHFDGIEIWSYMHDWVKGVTLLNIPKRYFSPDGAIDGPNEKVLGLWDRLNARRRVTGIGALDAHAVKMGFGLFTAFEYEFLFRTVLTHVLVDEWGGDAAADTLALRAALRESRAFVSYEVLGPAEGFRFAADGLSMGDAAASTGVVVFGVEVPLEGEIMLVHDGRRAAVVSGTSARFDAAAPGVYRVEVRRDGRPWIFSNPICLK